MDVVTLSTLLLLIQFVCCSNDLFGIREHMHNGGTLSSVWVPNLCPGAHNSLVISPEKKGSGTHTEAILIPIQHRRRYYHARDLQDCWESYNNAVICSPPGPAL